MKIVSFVHRVKAFPNDDRVFDGKEVNMCEVFCAFCVQISVPAVDGSRLSGVGNACVHHIA